MPATGRAILKPFHPPGASTKRGFGGYTPKQEEKWQIIADFSYALGYGFSQCRLPTPGTALPATVVEKRVGQFCEGWAFEAKRDLETRGLEPDEIPPSVQQYLTERLADYPQTDRPWAKTYTISLSEEGC